MILENNEFEKKVLSRTQEIFQQHRLQNFKATDFLFARLMIFQWIGAIVSAFLVAPRIWSGTMSQTHLHVWAAILLGGGLTLYPVLLAFTRPGQTFTRHTIAVSQMLMSALLIHLTGGRIETHFHVFGSLAFIAFYQDWKVLVPATIVVAADHWIRGVYWPQSVYGVLTASPWRWVEHAGWVVFEDIVLILSCIRQTQQGWKIAEQTAEVESVNQLIELKVEERTKELAETNHKLEKEIAERKRLENVMVESEKMSAVGQLAAGVAHEINNPLGVILGFSQGVVRRIKPGDPFEMPLKSIEREAVRCKQLVQDLLTFSRASKVEKETIDLNQAIEVALSLVLAQSKTKNVEIIKNLDASLPRVQANWGQIQQIVVNLSNNSMDAMSKGGRIAISSKKIKREDKNFLEIEISDSGKGIPKEIQSKIFDPFFTTKEIGKGTGLGLSLVYEIVKKHDGQIYFESEADKGTIFHILIPYS